MRALLLHILFIMILAPVAALHSLAANNEQLYQLAGELDPGAYAVTLKGSYKAVLGVVWFTGSSFKVGDVEAKLELDTRFISGKDTIYLRIYNGSALKAEIKVKELGTFTTGSGDVSAQLEVIVCGGQVVVKAYAHKVYATNAVAYTDGDVVIEKIGECKSNNNNNPGSGSSNNNIEYYDYNPGLGAIGLGLAAAAAGAAAGLLLMRRG